MTVWQNALAAQPRIAGFLRKLAAHPPKTLLLEGGQREERLQLALFWAASLNCQEKDPPCGVCRICQQFGENANRDLILLDGSEGAISIDTIRDDVRAVLGNPPAGQGCRVIILAEAQALGEKAANALLKSLEEPLPGNVFVLLAPNRELLLPTLLSRSFVLTLAWSTTDSITINPEIQEPCAALDEFLRSGTGSWLDWTGKKGSVDAALTGLILRAMQRRLLDAERSEPNGMALTLSRLGRTDRRQIQVILENAQECLDANANPALILEWLAIRIHGLIKGGPPHNPSGAPDNPQHLYSQYHRYA